ncbi:MAG TPA: VOC family protein [Vicinamibacteria bacterium]|nr:VOC family protein [Vicinamibacteria bacterium]
MSAYDQLITPTLTPSLVYEDAHQGIRWLVEVLGFREASLYENRDGGVAFAELVWRTGVLFVSGRPPSTNPWSKLGLASIVLVAEDTQAVDRLYERAVAVGADIVRPVHEARTPAFPNGSHQFDVRDPEGNLWTVGTFQPRIPVTGGAA